MTKISTLHIAIGLIILVVIVLNWKTIAKTLNIPTMAAADSPASATPVKLDCNRVLKKNEQGPEVVQLQTWMMQCDAKILPKYGADGDFGQETLSALQKLTGQSAITLKQAQTLLNTALAQLGMPKNIVSVC